VDRILQEQRRLSKEEESTEEELLCIQREYNEAQARIQREFSERLNERLARLARYRRQKRLLFQKGSKMVSEDLADMDEVEEAEQSEEARNSSTAVPSVRESGTGVAELEFDWGALGPVDPSLDPSLMVDLGFGGGTPQASAGNASGA
jgi:hypothetical protein